jgi:hypothetical protein
VTDRMAQTLTRTAAASPSPGPAALALDLVARTRHDGVRGA